MGWWRDGQDGDNELAQQACFTSVFLFNTQNHPRSCVYAKFRGEETAAQEG